MDAESFLRVRFGSVTDVTPLAGGEWSDAFAFRLDGDDRVIRFGRHRSDYEKDRRAHAFATTDLPIPAVYEIGATDEGYYAISARAFGIALDELDADQLETTLPSLFAAVDAMRGADTSRTAGYGVWDGEGGAPFASWADALLDVGNDDGSHRTSGWRARLDRDAAAAGAFDTGLGCLRELAPRMPNRRDLVHADFVNRNVLVDGSHIAAMLDWGCAMYGDALYDIANLCFAHVWFPAWAGVDIRGAARAHFATDDFDERMRCYEIHVGLGTIAYNAFTGRAGDVACAVRGTLAAVDRTTA